MAEVFYHIGFGRDALKDSEPKIAFLSGDPGRAESIAKDYLKDAKVLSEKRGLSSYLAKLPNGASVISATSGMGAPSLSIVVNELVQVGIQTIIRVGTTGSLQASIHAGDVVISQAALCRQGAANDIAPVEYPASADPFVTVGLVEAAKKLNVSYGLGVTASVDTFYEGQGRKNSANTKLLPHLENITEEYSHLGILNFEMEAGTLFKMGGVYGFQAGCICGVVAERASGEKVHEDKVKLAVSNAIQVAISCADKL